MQNPSIWERIRASIHEKSEPKEPKPVTINPSDLLWAIIFFIATALSITVCWAMKTNRLQWSESLYATGAIAAFATGLLSWSLLHHWLTVERSKKDLIDAKEARKVRAEGRIIEDRKKANAEKEAEKQHRRRGAIRNLYRFLFGEDTQS